LEDEREDEELIDHDEDVKTMRRQTNSLEGLRSEFEIARLI